MSEMNEYRNNLSRHLLNRLSELGGRAVDMARFGPSFKAGWQEWKKRSEQREESSFAYFLNREFKQIATAGADTATGSKFPPK